MRTGNFVALLLALMIVVPVQGGDVRTMQATQDDGEQPDANNTTLRLWSDGSSNEWSHFGASDDMHTEDNIIEEDRASGLLTIDLKFTMKPALSKKLNMTLDGEIRGQIEIYIEGDYKNDGTNNGPCSNDCENLTLALKAGATEIWSQEYGDIPMEQDHQILFSHRIEEDQTLWDKSTANPSLHVNMKLKGDESTSPFSLDPGQKALFRIYLSGDNTSKIELPIDPTSWDAAFQSDEMLNPPVETPGFTLVAGTVAMAMAAVWFRPSKIEEDSE